jgi:O-antigen/teichoic acid export membrane protein
MPSKSKRIAKNTILLYLRMLLHLGVSLYTSRIVLSTLGIEDFGVYSIVAGVVILFSFFNTAMSVATQRFLSYEIGKNNFEKLKAIFSTSVNVHICIAILVFILGETLGLWFIINQLNIPAERIDAAIWVYQFSLFAFIVKIIKVPYHAAIVANENMSFYAYLSILEEFLSLVIVFIIQIFPYDRLIFYGLFLFIVSIIVFFVYKLYCNNKYSITRYFFIWDMTLFKSIISFSGWSMFGSIANVGSKQGTNILLNIFFGVTLNATMGIANQVNNAINGFVQNFQTAFRPQIVKSYAAGDTKYLLQLVFQTSKFSFFLLYFVALPVLINTEFVLSIWLENVPDYAVGFVRLILVYSLFESISGPLWMTVQATGKIMKYQIIISIIIISNLWISYILLKNGFSPYVVLMVRIGVNLCSLIYRLFYLKTIIDFLIKNFMQKVLGNIILVVLFTFVIPVLLGFYTDGVSKFFFTTITSFFSIAFGVYFFGLNNIEKNTIKLFVVKTINKILKNESNYSSRISK